mgnify:CR=1 FL=1
MKVQNTKNKSLLRWLPGLLVSLAAVYFLLKFISLDDLVAAERQVGWDAEPAGKVSLDLGTAWVEGMRSAVLEVPSVVLPEESNFLINPLHPDAAGIRAVKLRRFEYDRRLR